MTFTIGAHLFHGGLWLAPLASTSNAAFRQICLEFGCEQTVTEMVSSEALVRIGPEKEPRLRRAQGENRLIVQLFGANPRTMAQAARIVIDYANADIIDINMGCPVRKILGAGAGVALMRSPTLAHHLVREVVRAAHTVPVTTKIRAGWDNEVNATQIAQAVQDAGASAIIVHGRTRESFHTGQPRWDIIAAVKHAVQLPVIGNGGVRSHRQALDMIHQTGCDAVMIGSGAIGNPWVFRQTPTGEPYEPSPAERFTTIRRHISLSETYFGDSTTSREMRKQLVWYLKGMRASSTLRARLHTMTSVAQMLQTLSDYEKNLQHDPTPTSPALP